MGRPRNAVWREWLRLVGRLDRRRVQRAGVVDLLVLVAFLAAADADRGRLLAGGLMIESLTSSSESSGAGSTITVAPGISSARSTKSASGSSM